MNSETSKSELRAYFLKKRLELSRSEHDKRSLAIANYCLKLPVWDSDYFHLFLPIKSKAEVNTTFILTLLQGRDKHIVLPKIEGTKLKHILFTDGTKLRLNSWGIPEPENGIFINPKELEVVFIPLVGWDKIGNRIGYGKGFYDNFLLECNSNIIKVGLSFFQPISRINGIIPKDIPMDYCVNPFGITRFN